MKRIGIMAISALARSKILKSAEIPVTTLETKVAEAYVDLEAHSKEFQGEMKSLQFYSVEEVVDAAAKPCFRD